MLIGTDDNMPLGRSNSAKDKNPVKNDEEYIKHPKAGASKKGAEKEP